MNNGFLPVTAEEMHERGLEQVDFVYVSGDAYVDHSSFGPAIITRILEAHGYTVGMIAQPDWKNDDSVAVFGEPRLAFLVSSGNMDSMVNHYTVAKKRRHEDAFSPGGKIGLRPDRALTVYCNLIRRTYKTTPILVGGLEASLRRLGHYDYWSDSVRRSVLLDAGADILMYGMGERSMVQLADALSSGLRVQDVTFVDGTVYKTRDESSIYDAVRLPDFEEIRDDKRRYAESFRLQYMNTDPFTGKRLYETYDGKMFVVQNPPQKPLSMTEMDDVYALPFKRAAHPMYDKDGGIPALSEIKFSLTSNRGCYGECNFCALTMHQGRIVQARSHESILAEAKQMLDDPDFKGYIHDVGGPTAEFRAPACKKQLTRGACMNRRCLFPKPCPNLQVDHSDYLALLRKLRELPGVKKVFVRSGFRFDYLLADPNKQFLSELCKYHISGQLRVAPEHISDNVLRCMGKPSVDVYDRFLAEFEKMNRRAGKEQYVVPYLMSSHPGSRLSDAIALAEYLHAHHIAPDQVQDFYPTPGTVSTTMYYTGLDPISMEPVYVTHNPHEKAMQRALIQYRRPENYDLVREALLKAGRGDLIGFGPNCLIPPRKMPSRYPADEKKPHGKPQDGKGRNEHPQNKKAAKEHPQGGKGPHNTAPADRNDRRHRPDPEAPGRTGRADSRSRQNDRRADTGTRRHSDTHRQNSGKHPPANDHRGSPKKGRR